MADSAATVGCRWDRRAIQALANASDQRDRLRAQIKMALDVIGPYPFSEPGPRGECIERKVLRRIEGILKEALGA